ncbi:hypothetical protein DL96DRAFT_1716328 [Flagelloscypha sp. PMI_526]|nr:hypothetical protein DL96DRAFT_1716328 [Flagelloscypha sp. PMI_526]
MSISILSPGDCLRLLSFALYMQPPRTISAFLASFKTTSLAAIRLHYPEASRATTAIPNLFNPIIIEDKHIRET